MLNRTLNPFLFPFNPFSLTPPMPTLAAAQRMESVEVGLKIEDLVVNYGQIDGAGEAFFVEDLLVDDGDGFLEAETEDKSGCVTEDKTITSLSTITKPEEVKDVGVDVFGSVPADDVADLEWLSHFVEDSFSSDSMMTCQWSEPAAVKTPTAETSVTTPINTKAARTKRARTGGRIWSSRSSSTSSSDPPEAGEKKKRKKMFSTAASGTAVARRCSHCGVQKTPQWRAGPMGAKTLCNACGVRFKSGRLFPEYRPACSPTFSSDVHSNNHRKVLEMRMKQNKNKRMPHFLKRVTSNRVVFLRN